MEVGKSRVSLMNMGSVWNGCLPARQMGRDLRVQAEGSWERSGALGAHLGCSSGTVENLSDTGPEVGAP